MSTVGRSYIRLKTYKTASTCSEIEVHSRPGETQLQLIQNMSLDELQSQINLSRDDYLQEHDLYAESCEKIEEEIVEGYFKEFCDSHPDRALIAKERAQDAIEEIKTFHSARAKLAINIAIGQQEM